MLRRLRAALTVGVVWAFVWLPIGAAVALYASARPPQPADLLFRPVDFTTFLTVWTAWGGLSGTAVAAVLAAAERRRTLGDLSPARTAAWGALGSMSVPTALVLLDLSRGSVTAGLYDWRPPLVVLAVSAVLGAACAAATLALARRPVSRG